MAEDFVFSLKTIAAPVLQSTLGSYSPLPNEGTDKCAYLSRVLLEVLLDEIRGLRKT